MAEEMVMERETKRAGRCNCNCGCDESATGLYKQFCDNSAVCRRCYDDNHVFGFRDPNVYDRHRPYLG